MVDYGPFRGRKREEVHLWKEEEVAGLSSYGVKWKVGSDHGVCWFAGFTRTLYQVTPTSWNGVAMEDGRPLLQTKKKQQPVPWKIMELWGQKVKMEGLTFMFHKMGSHFWNRDLRSSSDLEFPKEISSTSWFHLLLITVVLCGRLVKYYYQHRAKRKEKLERLSDLR